VRELLHLCARIGGPSLPAVHSVVGGFLVRLPWPSDDAFPGVIRLRALSPNLFAPVDARLIPALLNDEAGALVRQRGLVFLPGGTVLEFAPTVLLTAADLIAVSRPPKRAWRPLPPRQERPERLHEILLDMPDPPPEAIIEAGGGGIAVERPRLPVSGAGQTVAGAAAAKLGQGLMWLGDKVGWKGLAGLGASLVAHALRAVPRISESLLGRQEAALRELLRQFREGNIDEALRRALPLGASPGRGGTTAPDANLPRHDLSYRLGELLGAGNGAGSVWLASSNVYDDLEAAYRRAAEEATRRGDIRRAAFIYGKLLQDWRLAAGVLARGGLHHDAAILYLEKLHDPLAAAKAFEAGGEVDRALHLYRQRGEHTLAGDLLLRAGESERAVQEYCLAADLEAARGHHVAAGELLLNRAQRSDLAEKHFATGWKNRPHGDSLGCLLHLAELHANQPSTQPLLQLVAEADDCFTAIGNEQQAADFYNRLALLAGKDHLLAVRDDLLDRALLGLAAKLRQRHPGDHSGAVSRLFGGSGMWEPALVRDAEVALRGRPRSQPGPRDVARILTHRGQVTAACAAANSGDLFLGFEGGVLAHFNPRSGAVTTWRQPQTGDVLALAVDRTARALVVIQEIDAASYQVMSFQAQGACFAPQTRRVIERSAGFVPRLTPIASGQAGFAVGLWDGRGLSFLQLPDLVPDATIDVKPTFEAALVLDGWDQAIFWSSLLIFEADELRFARRDEQCGVDRGDVVDLPPAISFIESQEELVLPSFSPRTILQGGGPLFSWLAPKRTYLELAYVDTRGALHWLSLRVLTSSPAVLAHLLTPSEERYRCATLMQLDRIAAVGRRGVAWLACGPRGFALRSSTAVDLADAVACFASPMTKELLVVLALGDIVRLPAPG
jgi:tetratricopeptide (TPR) repeat protein